MRLKRCVAAMAVVACSLPGCGPNPILGGDGELNFTGPSDATSCARLSRNQWGVAVPGYPRPPLGVGSSVRISIFPPLLAAGCLQQIASVAWGATVPGIVRFTPVDTAYEAVLTGETSGETDLVAEITLLGGDVRTITDDDIRVVVPAASPE